MSDRPELLPILVMALIRDPALAGFFIHAN
jgi:hypothetical protein